MINLEDLKVGDVVVLTRNIEKYGFNYEGEEFRVVGIDYDVSIRLRGVDINVDCCASNDELVKYFDYCELCNEDDEDDDCEYFDESEDDGYMYGCDGCGCPECDDCEDGGEYDDYATYTKDLSCEFNAHIEKLKEYSNEKLLVEIDKRLYKANCESIKDLSLGELMELLNQRDDISLKPVVSMDNGDDVYSMIVKWSK